MRQIPNTLHPEIWLDFAAAAWSTHRYHDIFGPIDTRIEES